MELGCTSPFPPSHYKTIRDRDYQHKGNGISLFQICFSNLTPEMKASHLSLDLMGLGRIISTA